MKLKTKFKQNKKQNSNKIGNIILTKFAREQLHVGRVRLNRPWASISGFGPVKQLALMI
jgi:hypothetical protein